MTEPAGSDFAAWELEPYERFQSQGGERIGPREQDRW